jgi:cell shape-determining protein MreC
MHKIFLNGDGSVNSNFLHLSVSTDSKINNGDILTTSALEGIFPKDLLVGKIIEKEFVITLPLKFDLK